MVCNTEEVNGTWRFISTANVSIHERSPRFGLDKEHPEYQSQVNLCLALWEALVRLSAARHNITVDFGGDSPDTVTWSPDGKMMEPNLAYNAEDAVAEFIEAGGHEACNDNIVVAEFGGTILVAYPHDYPSRINGGTPDPGAFWDVFLREGHQVTSSLSYGNYDE